MKKLNRKGFTLVELLAIIVILAVILVVAIPPILDAMDNSKKKSLENSAKSVASGWSNNIAAALLDSSGLTSDQTALYLNWGGGTTGSDGYKCLTTTDAAVLGMDTKQYVFGAADKTNLSSAAPECSMAKVEGTAVTVVLVVKSGHQMYLDDAAKDVNGVSYMWASSDGTKSW